MEDHLAIDGSERTLGARVWGKKVARLPDHGVLLVATDLQGNRKDYERLKQLYWEEDRAGNEPILAFCGDMVHGPSPDLNEPGAWPTYLGTAYIDQSADIIRDFERFTRYARAFSLMGNHEHAHVGGPVVAKFYQDEAKVLDRALGADKTDIHAFLSSFPLIALSPCGVVLTHGAPMATEPRLDDFENLTYNGYETTPTYAMLTGSTIGALLWSRAATSLQAQNLLGVAGAGGAAGPGVVIYGHDIVPTGFEKIGKEQICLSTSFGVYDPCKTYVRLDLGARYRTVDDLRPDVEILPLYD